MPLCFQLISRLRSGGIGQKSVETHLGKRRREGDTLRFPTKIQVKVFQHHSGRLRAEYRLECLGEQSREGEMPLCSPLYPPQV